MRAALAARIIAERERQFNLPGIEFDIRNRPNDWTTIAAHYLFEDVRRGPVKPSRQTYEDCLIKAAAVILAALEHCDTMADAHEFSK
jgi:hypothetical protein